MNIYEIIRLVVTVGLLVVVWQNAHWSVALVLSLVAVGHEIMALKIRTNPQWPFPKDVD